MALSATSVSLCWGQSTHLTKGKEYLDAAHTDLSPLWLFFKRYQVNRPILEARGSAKKEDRHVLHTSAVSLKDTAHFIIKQRNLFTLNIVVIKHGSENWNSLAISYTFMYFSEKVTM